MTGVSVLDRGDRFASAGPRAWRAIALGGIGAAALDLCYAFTFNGLLGYSPMRVLQAIASGLLGLGAFRGGAAAAALGLVAHVAILLIAAALYYMASRRIAALTRFAWRCGVLYGLAIHATMHLVVLPLSAAPSFRITPLQVASDFAVHLLVLGPTIAFAARRFGPRLR